MKPETFYSLKSQRIYAEKLCEHPCLILPVTNISLFRSRGIVSDKLFSVTDEVTPASLFSSAKTLSHSLSCYRWQLSLDFQCSACLPPTENFLSQEMLPSREAQKEAELQLLEHLQV